MPNEWHTPLEVPGNRLPETGSRRKLLNVRGAWQEVWMQELEGKLKRPRQNRANIGNFKVIYRELIGLGKTQKQQDLKEGSCTEATPSEKT
ncbi:hypothetical protein V6N12_069052 [Hibiscus sabdariffa]|uniref:Uncharacterized protein n=1 Tax=Hibiscus sabdariffa TaxID=183260 RepID=A0ABR2FCR6_9ROSI